MRGVGTDCVGLILGVWKALGLIPSDYTPGPYRDDDGEMLERELSKWCDHIGDANEMVPGDVLVFSIPNGYRHVAFFAGDREIIHVYGKKIGCTSHRMDSKWEARILSVWRLRA